LVVHGLNDDDWSFPKGKCDEGESDEACALREVAEETGLRCELLEEIGETSYTHGSERAEQPALGGERLKEIGETSHIDGKGQPNVVRYWRMRAVDGEFAPQDEVDEIRWETPESAARVLSWSRDLPLLERL